ncbi:methionine--tRNA ligase subunit beta [bacterium]|nr:methionine--tRNA ligase subunit beta [bacterium]
MTMIQFRDFQKVELAIGEILEAKKIEGSEKLMLLKVDIGDEVRQIVAGIGSFYQPEDLIGKEIVVVVNLEPKKLMGYESRGMLLAAVKKDGEVVLIVPEKKGGAGTKVS